MRYIVRPSISLKRICHPTKITAISPPISIMESQKSTISRLDSPSERLASTKEKPMSTQAKKRMTVRIRFRRSSRNVFIAMLFMGQSIKKMYKSTNGSSEKNIIRIFHSPKTPKQDVSTFIPELFRQVPIHHPTWPRKSGVLPSSKMFQEPD